MTSSTSEAYSFVFKLLLDPAARAAVPAPSYPLLDSLLGLSDAIPARYRLFYEEQWRIDLQSLEEVLSGGCGALCLINPNNPTGHFIQEEEKHALDRLAIQYSVPVISDEVFFDFKLDADAAPVSFAGNKECLTFTLSGISKILGLPQMKLSWIVVSGPEAESREALRRLEMISDTFLSVSTPSQTALADWLARASEVQKEIMQRTSANRKFLSGAFTGRKGLKLLKTEGGWVSVLCAKDQRDDEELALLILKNTKVLVHPGYLYDFGEDSHLVLSLLPREEGFREAVGRIQKALA